MAKILLITIITMMLNNQLHTTTIHKIQGDTLIYQITTINSKTIECNVTINNPTIVLIDSAKLNNNKATTTRINYYTVHLSANGSNKTTDTLRLFGTCLFGNDTSTTIQITNLITDKIPQPNPEPLTIIVKKQHEHTFARLATITKAFPSPGPAANTKIEYLIDIPSNVQLKIFNERGQIVLTHSSPLQQPGTYTITTTEMATNTKTNLPQTMPAGTYYIWLVTSSGTDIYPIIINNN